MAKKAKPKPEPLTVAGLKAMTAPAGGRIEVYDAGGPGGFGVRVGAREKTFFLVYRSGGKKRRFNIGNFPEVSLQDARKKAEEIHGGELDPAAQRERERSIKDFSALAALFEEHYKPHVRPKTWESYGTALEQLKAQWGDFPLSEITRSRVKLFLEAKAAEHPFAANRIRGTLHRLYTWANEKEILESNPVSGIKRPGFAGKKEPSRDRVLSHAEMRSIWLALDAEQPVPMAYLKMLFLTGLRKTEVLGATWEDVDLESGWWRIPAIATKSRMPLDVPITAPMRDLFLALKPFTGRRSHVFASFHANVSRPIAGLSKIKRRVAKNAGVTGWRLHDIRRTVTSSLAEMGIRDEVLRAVLGHTITGALAHYQRNKFAMEKRAALEKWADKLSRIVEDQGAEVVPISR